MTFHSLSDDNPVVHTRLGLNNVLYTYAVADINFQ